LYEYLFGLGKHLAEKYPKFVQSGNDPFDVESLAFSVATVVHQVKIPAMSELPHSFNKTGDSIDPTIFQIGLEEAFERYGEIVRPIYSLQLNAKNTEVKIPIPEFQLSSYISRIFAGKYDAAANFETRSNFEEDWGALTQGIRESFLIDTLSQYWRGSGDSKVFDRVWSSPTSESITLNPAYTVRRNRDAWENILNSWFDESLESRQKDRSSIRPPEKTFLRYIYMKLVSVFDNADEKFELDHVIPIYILKSLIPEEDEGWPLSNIANLTLLPSEDNARKNVDTLQAYLLRLAGEGKQDQVGKITKLAVSPINICDIPSPESGIKADREWYMGFLKERFVYMKEAFYDAMGITG